MLLYNQKMREEPESNNLTRGVKKMINVNIDEDTLLELLSNRVRAWRDGEVAELFDKMYENEVENSCFEGCTFDPMIIVDNDIVNYCTVIEEGDPDYEQILKLHHDGEYDISCESFEHGSYSFIEAVSDDEKLILVRY